MFFIWDFILNLLKIMYKYFYYLATIIIVNFIKEYYFIPIITFVNLWRNFYQVCYFYCCLYLCNNYYWLLYYFIYCKYYYYFLFNYNHYEFRDYIMHENCFNFGTFLAPLIHRHFIIQKNFYLLLLIIIYYYLNNNYC